MTANGVTATTVNLSWDDGGNPAGTSFDVQHSLDGVSFTSLAPQTSTSTTDTGLLSSTTYFYRVQALNADGLGQRLQRHGVSTQTVGGLRGARAAQRSSRFAQRNDVHAAMAQRPARCERPARHDSAVPHRSLHGYFQQRARTRRFMFPPTAQSYSEAAGGTVEFYQVTALAAGGGVSAPSDFCDSSSALNRYALAPDDLSTRVVMPAAVADELRKENNIYGEDLEIRLTRRQQDEQDDTLRSYNIGAYIARTGSEVFNFAFSKPAISVQMGYGAVLGTTVLQSNQVISVRNTTSRASAGSIAQIIAVYWFNGQNFLRISDPILTSSQALSVTVRSLGTYQIRAARIANQFSLSQGSPYPRVITPNGAENRKVFFFFENPTDDQVQGTIYDIHGAKVRDLSVDGQSPTTSSIVWDGRDSNGAVVPSGVYLYKISTGQDKATGSLVVAR